MLIKILKPFSFQGTKYQIEQEVEIKDANKVPAEIFWRNRLNDKDIEIIEKTIDIEIIEKVINKK